MPLSFQQLFRQERPLIGMIHTGPTPGHPDFASIKSGVERAIAEADIYLRAGMDGLLIENMWDFPCLPEREMGPEVAAYMTRIARSVKRRARSVPVGIQVLFQGNRTALAVALAAKCDFVRAEGWTYAHVSDKGIAEASAGSVVRYRHAIGADHIPIYPDVRKKHAAHAWTADLSLAEIVRGMALHRADGVILTGTTTGEAPDLDDLRAARAATTLPLFVGSGVDSENMGDLLPLADALIVGSSVKEGGQWQAPVVPARVQALVAAADRARAALRQAALAENGTAP